ncbi:thiol:disulfide interchange protein [Salmonella enterica subsp. arizonae]|uniref:Thiol:disulfide interchange protein n=1 Tax=Salmonella enterica subsp. arizonae TaxID=59203 RepID=A0A379T3U1_SALER|nr:thiol:disulfide interchange protein [Salmonella enterica subsp. arizonae]
MKRNVLLLPLLIFLLIAAALLWQLARNAEGDDPTALESALTGKAGAGVPPGIAGDTGSVLSGGGADAGETGAA